VACAAFLASSPFSRDFCDLLEKLVDGSLAKFGVKTTAGLGQFVLTGGSSRRWSIVYSTSSTQSETPTWS